MGSTVSAKRRVGSASLSRVGSVSAESCRREHMGSTVSAKRRVGSASLSRVGSTAGAAATGAAQHASATRSVSAPAILLIEKFPHTLRWNFWTSI
jgi:hypothetical protein